MALGTLLIRADANITIGTGHVMRCLALAQAWQDAGGRAIFALADATPATLERLKAESCHAELLAVAPGSPDDAYHTCALAESLNAEWVVLDGGHFGGDYQQTVRFNKRKVLCLDDLGESDYYFADVILNQNSNASESSYRNRLPESKLLLTPKYALLRREFNSWTEWHRPVERNARKVLISMGGSDPDGLTGRIYKVGGFSGLETIFLLGGSVRPMPELTQHADDHVLTDRLDMAELMAECDITVICGGGTLWESMFMGCATISYSRNGVQDEVIRCLGRYGGVIDLGSVESFNYEALSAVVGRLGASLEKRKMMSRIGRVVVDGLGASRVVEAMRRAA